MHPQRLLCWHLLVLVWSAVGLVAVAQPEATDQILSRVSRARSVSKPASNIDAAKDSKAAAEVQSRATHVDSSLMHQEDASSIDLLGCDGWANGGNTGIAAVAPLELSSATDSPANAVTEEECSSGSQPTARIRSCGGRPEPSVLAWLREHQNVEGYWSSTTFFQDSTRSGASWSGNLDRWANHQDWRAAGDELLCTALALGAFVSAGYDHVEGAYRRTCRNALVWLKKHQLADGSFDNCENYRDHAIITSALGEIWGFSEDDKIKPMAEKALGYLLVCRASASGWGVNKQAEPDVVSTTYAVLAVRTAQLAELEVNAPWEDVGSFLDSLLCDNRGFIDSRYSVECERAIDEVGRIHARGPIANACWVLSALLIGHCKLSDRTVKRMARGMVESACLPMWGQGRVDFEYWWLGTQALFQVGGKYWERWAKSLVDTLNHNQRGYRPGEKELTDHQLDERGSWDSAGGWNPSYSRVTTTALGAITLECYFRYGRLKDRK
jgi:hypothetical protein